MALKLTYRVEPHPGINNEIYDALAKQVGKVGIQIQLNIGPEENPEATQVLVNGQFTAVEGEHFSEVAAAASNDDKVRDIVHAVLNDLTGRRGFGQEWHQIDPEIQEEIRESLRSKVRAIL